MSIDLIESNRRSQKSARGVFVSVAIHAGVITLAVYATASAGVVSVKVPADTVTIVYTPIPEEPKDPSTPKHLVEHLPQGPDRLPPLREPHLPFPTTIPDHLPPISTSESSLVDGGVFAVAARGDSGTMAGTFGGGDGQSLFAAQVEKPALPRAGNPIPKYPSVLESSRIEGTVLVQFVVDTLGRADMSTFKVLDSSNALFAQSLEATLPKWRFYPAEASGRRVKEIVQLPLKFVAPHH